MSYSLIVPLQTEQSCVSIFENEYWYFTRCRNLNLKSVHEHAILDKRVLTIVEIKKTSRETRPDGARSKQDLVVISVPGTV